MQTEAKVDSCYPVALEEGHPTFHLRPLHRTTSAVQIFIQTGNYYRFAQNTALTFGDTFLHTYGPVGIALDAHIFPLSD
jgi:hypothetical protein